MVFKEIRKHLKEESGQAETQETTAEYTLKGIVENPERNELLMQIARQEAADNGYSEDGVARLAEAVVRGETLTNADLQFLEKCRAVVVEKIDGAKKINSALSKEELNKIAEQSPELKALIDTVGSEGLQRVFGKQLESLAINDGPRFQRIVESVLAGTMQKNEITEREVSIKNLCRQYKISEQALTEALKIEDDGHREQAINSAMGRAFGALSKGSWLGMSLEREQRIAELTALRDEIITMSGGLDNAIQTVGTALAASVMDNEAMRKGLLAELGTTKETPKEQAMGLKEGQALLDEGKMKDEFKKFIAEKPKDVDVAIWEANDKEWRVSTDGLRTKEAIFRKAFEQKRGKKTGFWATIFQAMFEGKIASIDVTE